MQQATEELFLDVQTATRQRHGTPASVVFDETTFARPGDLYPIVGTEDHIVYLPPADIGVVGQAVTIVNARRGTGTVRIQAHASEAINGKRRTTTTPTGGEVTITTNWTVCVCICLAVGEWAVVKMLEVV